MRINALRKELQELISMPQTSRKPVLRRSLREEWLYATDIPGVCDVENLTVFLEKIRSAGWEYTEEKGWILMRKPAGKPPEGWYEGPFGPEAGCCLSLLDRHGQKATDEPEHIQRILIKAGEEGEKKYEEACTEIHRNWAARLRRGEALPGINQAYFTAERNEKL